MGDPRMQFEIAEQSILDNVLGPAEAGRFVTIGGQRQRESAEAIDDLRKVMVFYDEGTFPESGGAQYGPVRHDMTFKVVLMESTPAKADLFALNDESASADAKAEALRQMAEPSIEANRNMNKFIRIIWQILMDARNEQMGMVPPDDRPNLKLVSSRWISNIRKADPAPEGEFVVLTAEMDLTVTVKEDITGDDLPATPKDGAVYDGDIEFDGDDVAAQGVKVTNT